MIISYKIFFTVLTVISIWISLKLIKIAGGERRIYHLNLISLSYFYALLPNSIGSLLILIGLAKEHYAAQNLNNLELNLIVWFLCLITPIIVLSIMAILSYVFKVNKLYRNFMESQINFPKDRISIYFLLLFSTFITVLSSYYSFRALNGIPLLKIFYLTPYEIQISRYEAKFEFSANPFIKNLTGMSLSIIISYICFVYLIRIKRDKFILFIWLLNSIIAVLLLTYDYEKLPLVMYLLGYALLHIFSCKTVSKRAIIGILLITFLSAFLLAFFTFQYEDFLYAFSINGPIGRLFIGQIVPLYYHLIYFPEKHSFLYGANYPKFIAQLFSKEYIRSSKIVMDLYSTSQYAGHMNTVFIAEAYANWGISGILFSFFVVGFVLESLYILFLSLPKTPITISILAYNSTEFAKSINGGFYDFVYNPGLLFSLLILLVFNFIYMRGVIK